MLTRLARTTALLAAGLLAAAVHAQAPCSPVVPCCPVNPHCTAVSEPKMVLVPYQVTELVLPSGGTATAPGKKGEPAKTTATRVDDLIKTIQETIAPKSWASHGGRGTIDYFPMTMTLVVNQTPEVQEQVADLLVALLRVQDAQVVLEVRLVTVPDQFFERIGVDFNVNTATDKAPQGSSTQFHPAGFVNDFTPDKFLSGLTPAGTCTRDCATPVCESKSGPVFLSAKQVALFLEGVQGDPCSNVMQAPKITTLNGQTAHVDCTEKQFFVTGLEVVQNGGQPLVIPRNEEVALGFRMSACPKVSADRRSVLLDLEINKTALASTVVPVCPVTVQLKDDHGRAVQILQLVQQPKLNTMHIEKTLTIPDGGTVLLGGPKWVSEGRNEFGPPVLSKVPYINRLFKNVGYALETQRIYVLVTPRILVNKEEEPRQTACTRCQDAPCCPPPAIAGRAEESEPVEAPAGQTKAVAELLKEYDAACAAHQERAAAKFARAALILDPTCFAKARGR